jgi:hypothetical protein
MSQPRVNLVIACWGGARRTPDPQYEADRSHYLKLQMDSLSRFSHPWTDTTFVSTGGREDYLDYLDGIRSSYKVIDRPDIGMSYGSFDAAWKIDQTYDYYIFLEDDFVFVRDDFDIEMVNYFETLPDCGYLCQLAWGLRVPHPAVMNGIASNECLSRLGHLPGATEYDDNSMHYYGKVQTNGQKAWGDRVLEVGLKVYDMGRKFRAPFIEADGSHICWHPTAPKYIIAPAQIYHQIIENPDYVEQYTMIDEDWVRFKTFYLFMRNVYLSDEDRARFIATVAPCRVKTREDLARATAMYDGIVRNRENAMKQEMAGIDSYIAKYGEKL